MISGDPKVLQGKYLKGYFNNIRTYLCGDFCGCVGKKSPTYEKVKWVGLPIQNVWGFQQIEFLHKKVLFMVKKCNIRAA